MPWLIMLWPNCHRQYAMANMPWLTMLWPNCHRQYAMANMSWLTMLWPNCHRQYAMANMPWLISHGQRAMAGIPNNKKCYNIYVIRFDGRSRPLLFFSLRARWAPLASLALPTDVCWKSVQNKKSWGRRHGLKFQVLELVANPTGQLKCQLICAMTNMLWRV